MSSNDGEEIATEVIRLPFDHPVMQRRDHHVMRFLRVQADDTDLGTIKIRVPAVDRLWQEAYEFGFQCGAALRATAEAGTKGKRK